MAQIALTSGTLSLSCAVCTGKNLNGFCVSSCSAYFLTNCSGVAGTLISTNNCNRPIEDSGVCIIPIQTNIANGDSGNFGPCLTTNMYLSNYVCIACTGTSQYIDY